jgi:hypothetical protein
MESDILGETVPFALSLVPRALAPFDPRLVRRARLQ